jgi:hypothetical protein
MFDPSRDQARAFFFETWKKYRAGLPLAGLEKVVVDVMLLHPEYEGLLNQEEKHKAKDYDGESNPFLHMSLHLALEEQLQIDQPPGIRAAYETLLARKGGRHEALHEAIECLAETIWRAQKDKAPPDAGLYLDCLKRKGTDH